MLRHAMGCSGVVVLLVGMEQVDNAGETCEGGVAIIAAAALVPSSWCHLLAVMTAWK